MSQVLKKTRNTQGSLRDREDARSLLLRMAQEAERAERVRQLKRDRPDLTWAQIADAVGVKERSAIQWQKTGGIDYGNAKKLAELFGVSIAWLWAGIESAPDHGASPNGNRDGAVSLPTNLADELGRIHVRLDRIEGLLRDASVEREVLVDELKESIKQTGRAASEIRRVGDAMAGLPQPDAPRATRARKPATG